MIFDLLSRKQWKRSLPKHIQNLSVIKFLPNNNQQIIAGTKDGKILTIALESQSLAINEEELSGSIKSISFSSISNENSIQYILAATNKKAILFDSQTLKTVKICQYCDNYDFIKQIDFIPINISQQQQQQPQQIFARLSDDSIVIWSDLLNLNVESSSKYFYPLQMREKYLEKNEPIELNLNTKSNDADEYNQLISKITTNYSNGRIKYVAISSDAKQMCISTIDGSLMIFIAAKNDWKLDKIYFTTCMSIRQCIFMCPTPLSNAFLACVTSGLDIILLHLDKPMLKIILQESLTKHIVASSNSLMLGAILSDGECLIFNLPEILKEYDLKSTKDYDAHFISHHNKHTKDGQITQNISRHRLTRILNEFNVYPLKYRTIIWQTLLDLPKNVTEFGLLVEKGFHACTNDYEQRFPSINATEMRKLKCICSFLAHWCKVKLNIILCSIKNNELIFFNLFRYLLNVIIYQN